MKSENFIYAGLIFLSALTPALANDVAGHVQVRGRAANAPVATIVYAESLEGRMPVRPGHFKMAQRNKAFVPHLLVVPVGSAVDFSNEDPIFHNVFSITPPHSFDLGLYRAGASKSRVFLQPETFRVFCNIHPQMGGIILVLPTSLITEADNAGNYRLDLPPGSYRLTAWSERSRPVSTEITVSSRPVRVPELLLDESGYVEVPHKNKFGQAYPKTSYDPLSGRQPR
jgi:plastocyanin